MPQIGRYCKAYSAKALSRFPGWSQKTSNQPGGPESSEPEYLFLQQNHTVTRGIYLDEGVVFDEVTPEWIEFCKNELQFEIPSYEKPSHLQATPTAIPAPEAAVRTTTV